MFCKAEVEGGARGAPTFLTSSAGSHGAFDSSDNSAPHTSATVFVIRDSQPLCILTRGGFKSKRSRYRRNIAPTVA